MKRAEILDAAKKCVCQDRNEQYGSPEDNFGKIAELWSAYRGELFLKRDVAMMMALVKIARIYAGESEDSYIDLAGYAACGGELASEEKKEETSSDPLVMNRSLGKQFLARGREDAPRGRFCIATKKGWIGIDNTSGDYWMEEFKTREECLDWLDGKFEVGDKEENK
ncbi:MAG: DUF6378 domain-containing protein [Lachnospiraceae bacterium]|nr:DUF6378 domain-containing protein [Lachnospiraceae bacterium]